MVAKQPAKNQAGRTQLFTTRGRNICLEMRWQGSKKNEKWWTLESQEYKKKTQQISECVWTLRFLLGTEKWTALVILARWLMRHQENSAQGVSIRRGSRS